VNEKRQPGGVHARRRRTVAAAGAKLGLAALLAFLSPIVAASPAFGAQPKALSMAEAVDMALRRSGDLRDARDSVRQKQSELEQAYYAKKSADEKDSGLFAKPRNLSQQQQIRMKVPQAQMQLTVAVETERQKRLETRFDAEKAYLLVYQTMLAERDAHKRRDDAHKALDSVRTKLRYGLAKPPDVEAAEQALQQAESDYKQAQLTAKGARLALGEKIGVTLEDPVDVSFEPIYADLSQSALPGYIANALRTNISLIQDVQTRRLADEKLNVTRNLYASKFGAGRMKVFDRMFAGGTVDMDLFMASYEALLKQVRKDWQGYFWFLFFPIPKKLFQGEYDGLRYLDDLRNGLPIAVMEQAKAAAKEKESRSAVIAAVRQSYLDTKASEESYAQALRARDAASAKLAETEAKRRLGLVAAEELDKAKAAYEDALKQVTSAQLSYRTAIGKLNVDTGGAVERTYRPGILPYKGIDDGLGAVKPAQDQPASGKWTVKPAIGELLSDFSISPDKKLKATDYALFDAGGKPVGKRTPANKPLRALSLYFAKPEQLRIVLYRGSETIGQAPLEGGPSTGLFKLSDAQGAPVPAEAKAGVVIIGTLKANVDALTPEIYNAAAATMKTSGQGTYFSPDGSTWFDMDRITDAAALDDPAGALQPDELSGLALTLEVPDAGSLKSLQTPEQLDKEIANLKADLEQLEEDKQAATDSGKTDQIAGLTTQVEDAKARIAMLEALKKGDVKTALAQMALVNNPEAILAALAEQEEAGGQPDDGSDGGDGTGTGEGDGTGEETPSGESLAAMSAEELEALAAQQEAAVSAAIASGDAAAAQKALDGLLATLAQYADADSGASEGLAVLAEAEAATAAELKRAEAEGDAQGAESLMRALEAVQASALQTEKELLLAQLGQLEALADKLTADPAPAEGSPEAAALEQVVGELESRKAELLKDIKEKQKETYTEAEQQTIAQAAGQIAAETGGAAVPMPAESLTSPTVRIKLDAPPILVNGNAFIPLRAVSESFGAAVDWDEETMTATVSTEYGTSSVTIGQKIGYVNGEPVELEEAAELIAERTYVPLRFLAESLGFDIEWYGDVAMIVVY
jgi:hypothetical protein